MLKKVLITGGAGTIGYFLGKSLADQGYKVTLADNLSRGELDSDLQKLLELPNVKFVNLDVTLAEDFKKLDTDYDYVYHLAAVNGTRNFYEIPDVVLKVGILGVINILDWFKKNKKGKILFTSSNEAYASTINLLKGPLPTPENVHLGIDDITNPRWSYGGSKIAGELLFLNYGRQHKFPFTIIRYHNSYGPRMGNEHVVPNFFERILKKEDPFKIYGAKHTRSFCYIDDTIKATQLVMETEKTNGEIVHIGNDQEEISMKDLAEKMFQLFNYRPQVQILDAPRGSVLRRLPDLQKIRKLTDYQPSVDLNEGLKRTMEWYRLKYKSVLRNDERKFRKL